jgi:hypothetical protein
VIFLVENNMRIERRSACGCGSQKEIYPQQKICTCSHQKHRNEEVRRIVALVAEVRRRDEMIFGIVAVMEVDVVAKEPPAHRMVAELVMHECLRK